jgi:hypothetical protein
MDKFQVLIHQSQYTISEISLGWYVINFKKIITISEFNCTIIPKFSELIKLANKYGHDAFPLINQTYYPNYKEMV